MTASQSLLLSGLSLLGSLPGGVDPGRGFEGGRTQVDSADWVGIRAAHEAWRHGMAPEGEGWACRNPGQAWGTEFDGRGFLVEPQGGDWAWGLELVRYGWCLGPGAVATEARAAVGPAPMSLIAAALAQVVAPRMEAPGGAQVEAEASTLRYRWDENLTEWFENRLGGLEHGFTLASRPAGRIGNLTLELAVRGGLEPRIADGGRDIAFGKAGAAALVDYRGLLAFDATGRDLPARFELAGDLLRLTVDDAGAIYPLTIDPVAQQAYLKASNTGLNDDFGGAVAVSGNTVVVAARFEDSNATGVNGNQADNSTVDSGAAYVFVKQGGVWSQQAYLKASNPTGADLFGTSVAISGDTIAVGAFWEDSNATGINGNQASNSAADSGAVYVFVRSNGNWSQQAYIKASNTGADDQFGLIVALSGDTLVVGAPFEDSSATGINGDQTSNSSGNSGAAYVFVRSAGTWSQQAYLKASNTGGLVAGDNFGHSVGISGDTIVVGAWGEDSNATGVNGNQADNTAVDSGAVYVFVRNAGLWSQQAYLKASNTGNDDWFGWAVAVSGDTIAVGAYSEDSNATGSNGNQANNLASGAGAVYAFQRSSGTWNQEAYLKASNTGANDQFGRNLALSGEILAVAARSEDSNATGINGNQANETAFQSGATYVLRRTAGTWNQIAYLKASNAQSSDHFGWAVAASGELVVATSIFEASSATGVNGNQADNSLSSGAAYLFDLGLGLGVQSYGTGTVGCNGAQILGVNQAPMIGSPAFALTCSNAPPSSAGFGVLATAPDLLGSDPFGLGVLLHIDPLSTALLSLPFSSDALGNGLAPAAIPNNPALVGKTLYAQVLWAWTTCSLPPFNLSTSNGLALTFLLP
jgi:FG-GAP repeat